LIKKDWENTTVVKAGEMFDLEITSKNILLEAFNIAEANGRPGYALNGLLIEMLSSTQITGKGIKTILAKVTNADWNLVIDNIVYIYDIDKKKQIRVILIWNYYLKNLYRSDTLPDSIPTIKRTGEGVILIKDSPSSKKDKSGPPTTITQFTQAAATTTTQQGLIASNLRQIQTEQQGRTFFREILQRYHCQLARCENTTKICISKGGRHFILNQEAPKLWNNTIITQEATIESFPVALFHLLTIQEPSGDRGRRLIRQKDSSLTPSRSCIPAAPQFIIMPSPVPAPAPAYGLPPYHPAMAQHPWFPPPAGPGRGSSPPMPEDPADLLVFIAWFKIRGPLNADAIEGCIAALNQEKDSLNTLKTRTENGRRDGNEEPKGNTSEG
jgi:hypothetical protein